jgi:Rhs element Vgr protein
VTSNAELAFAHPHITLTVRAFVVQDGLSRPFDCHVTAGSEAADIDLDLVVGHPAALRIATGDPEQPYSVWSGIVSEMEQVSIEATGVSIYALRIVPMLWRCKQRRNHRVFQHLSVPEIVQTLLAEWGIDVVFRLDEARFPRHEYRVQYGESDFAFVSRLLEDEGIVYLLEQVDPDGKEKDETEPPEEEALPSMQLVLTEAAAQTAKRFDVPFPYIGQTDDISDAPYITKVRVGRSVRAGRFTLGSYDYRSSAELRLLSEAKAGHELEERYESYHYIPGAFLAEPRPEGEEAATPVADRARGPGASVDEALGARQARIGLERCRSRQRQLVMTTNQLVLSPGVVFAMDCHPRPDLDKEIGILVVGRRIEGEQSGNWCTELTAVFSADPFRPERVTPRPRVMGVQSALVVGPDGEEIYCDELGRVRVQFFWDRYGKRDQDSSCWIRVGQAWAGSGYGMSAIPRVGHEVLVDFIEGDPDHPIVVGRAHQRGAIPPDQLPRDKTKTTWRSSSSPGGEGYNEISMNDARGEEKLYFRAEKDLSTVVLNNEEAAVGADASKTIRGSDTMDVGRNQELHVVGDRKVQVDGNHTIRADRGLQAQAGRTTGMSCVDGKLVLTNGSASIVFDGPNIYIDAESNLRMSAGRSAGLYGKQVNIDGRPEVYINSGMFVGPQVSPLPGAVHSGQGGTIDGGDAVLTNHSGAGGLVQPGGMDEAEFDGKGYLLDLVNDQFGTKLKWPKAVKLPPEWDEQLERAGRVVFKGNGIKGKLMDPETYKAMKERLDARLAAEKARLEKLGTDFRDIFQGQRQHYGETMTRLKDRLGQEGGNLAKLRTDLGDVFSGKHGDFIASAKALGQVAKEQWNNIKALKKDLGAMLEQELAYFEHAKEEWKAYADGVKEVVEDFKQLIDDPKDALLDIVFGEDKELAHDIADLAEEFGYGDEVGDFLGLDEGVDGAVDGAVDGLGGVDDLGGSVAVDPGRIVGKFPGLHDKVLGAGGGSVNVDAGRIAGSHPGLHEKVMAAGGQPSMKYGAGTRASALGGKNAGLDRVTGPKAKGQILGQVDPGIAKKAGGTQYSGNNMSLVSEGEKAALAGGGKTGANALTAGSNHADFVSQRGGLAAKDVAGAVSDKGPSVLQSPGDGQLLVVPKDGAAAVDPSKLSSMMVDAQMEGQAVDGAIASALQDQGYAVYKRGWGDWMGPFVEAGKGAAATA